jgi:hypothetical protein
MVYRIPLWDTRIQSDSSYMKSFLTIYKSQNALCDIYELFSMNHVSKFHAMETCTIEWCYDSSGGFG